MLPTDAMKNFDELAEAVKSRELSFDETMYILQQVQEMTLANDKNLSKWTRLLGFMKEYQGLVPRGFTAYDSLIEKTIENFYLLAKYCPDLESIQFGQPAQPDEARRPSGARPAAPMIQQGLGSSAGHAGLYHTGDLHPPCPQELGLLSNRRRLA